jgi:flagellar protein FliL
MADTTKQTEETAAADKQAEAPRRGKLPLFAVLSVALVGGGAGGAYIFLRPQVKAHGTEAKEREKDKEKSEAPAASRVVVPLNPFIVNLNEEEQVSYLKCSLAVEVTTKEWAAALETKAMPIRSAVILYLSSLTLGETRGTNNKQKILDELTTRIGDQLGEGAVSRIYLSEFVIQ